jgi:hypothetical protein
MKGDRKMNNKKSEPETKGKLDSVIKFILIVAVVWLLGVSLAFVLKFHNHSIGDPEAWGLFGDYFGGMLNPVIALAALMALFSSIRIQQKELKDTREQLAESTVAQEELVKATMQSQRIAYAASLIPLIEASRNELITMMQSDKKVDIFHTETGVYRPIMTVMVEIPRKHM